MDLLNRVIVERKKGKRKVIESKFLNAFKRGRVKGAFLSIWVEERYRKDELSAMKRMLDLISTALREFKESKRLTLVKSREDLEKGRGENDFYFLLSMEGLDGIGDNPELLYLLKESGIRMVSLTWNNSNAFAKGTYGEGSFSITKRGVEALKTLRELNLILDLAHISDDAFWKAINLYEDGIIVVSHTAIRSICEHPRNLTDDMIKAIAERNGVIGIAAIPSFIKKEGRVNLSDFIEHVKYATDLVEVEHIALGLDYECFLPPEAWKPERPPIEGLECIEKSANIITALQKEGFTKEDIDKITHLNWERVILRSLAE